MRNANYVQYVDDELFSANGDGTARKTILTPKSAWALGLGIKQFLAGLDVTELSTNAGVTVRWEWSLDGVKWNTGSTLVTEKTAMGQYTGPQTTTAELAAYSRIVVEVRDTVGTTQATARLSAWGLYWYV